MVKKILITNAVPTNNGDAALVFGLYDKLIEEGYDVVISTIKYNTIKEIYPNKKWIKAEYDFNKITRGILKIFPFAKKFIFRYMVINNKIYKDIDVVISAPGGYINSYYGFKDKLYCMNLIKKIYRCKLIMYSQSVGPLNEEDKIILDKYMDIFDLFMARDEISYNVVSKYNNTIMTNDAAFLLDIKENNNKDDIVGISVREWGFDGRNKDKYIELMKNIVIKCINNGNKVEFISTCQGIQKYVDDSVIANKIKEELSEEYKKNIYVNKNYYSIYQLRERISKYKFIIGTRLHMCILAIMSGVPAFNISYEVKGIECYKILKLSQYSIDYNDDVTDSLTKLQEFIDENESLKNIYSKKAKLMNVDANKYFDYMIKEIIEG